MTLVTGAYAILRKANEAKSVPIRNPFSGRKDECFINVSNGGYAPVLAVIFRFFWRHGDRDHRPGVRGTFWRAFFRFISF
jgi:hypothetical protein